MAHYLVVAEGTGDTVSDLSLQCLGKAREAATVSGGTVGCVVIGTGLNAVAAQLALAADRVWVSDAPEFAAYVLTPYRKAVEACLAERPADVLLFPASTFGDDLAPAVAQSIGAACVLDCEQAEITPGGWVVRRLEFDRKVSASYISAAGKPLVVSFKDGVAIAPAALNRTGEIIRLPVALSEMDRAVQMLRRDVAAKTVNLKEAPIIVAGGAGVGSAEHFALVRELAVALGAEVGATRAVVDAGWLPADHQIGQTGATVRPNLYIACGISGAVQHRVGMLDSRKIVAINTDPNAPIFRIAHYKIVGDLKVVLPKLIRLLKN